MYNPDIIRPTCKNDMEYKEGLATLRQYFLERPPFFEPQWRMMTFLLQAVCKYEHEVLGYTIPKFPAIAPRDYGPKYP